MMDISRIKKVAKDKNMNLQDLAKKAGLGVNTIYHWKEQTPSTKNLNAVADILNVSTDYLLGKTDDPTIIKDGQPTEMDIKQGMENKYTIMSYGGRQIPAEELEMIRRILDGGK